LGNETCVSLLAGSYVVFQSTLTTNPNTSRYIDSENPATKDPTNTLRRVTDVFSQTKNSKLLEIARAFARHQTSPLKPGDVVEVYVVGEEDLHIKSPVRNNGDITTIKRPRRININANISDPNNTILNPKHSITLINRVLHFL